MNDNEWSDPRIRKAFFKAPPTPSAFETEAFVSRVMARIDESRVPVFSPFLRLIMARWTVPALGLGIAAVFLSIQYTVPAGSMVVNASITGADASSAWVIPMDNEP